MHEVDMFLKHLWLVVKLSVILGKAFLVVPPLKNSTITRTLTLTQTLYDQNH